MRYCRSCAVKFHTPIADPVFLCANCQNRLISDQHRITDTQLLAVVGGLLDIIQDREWEAATDVIREIAWQVRDRELEKLSKRNET